MTNLVEINGKQCDLSKAFPIKMGVYKKLLQENIDLSSGNLTTLESMRMSELIIMSANKDITAEDCDEINAEQMTKISEIINALNKKAEEVAIAPLEHG